jgi:5-methylcytosine-specific restriction enzyme B
MEMIRPEMKPANRIREHVRLNHIEPSRSRGQAVVQVRAGDIRREMRLGGDQTAAICSALKTQKFLDENRLIREKLEGPPKKMGASVVFTFRLRDEPVQSGPAADDPMLKLYGIAKNLFDRPGDWEESIRKDREQFYGPDKEL